MAKLEKEDILKQAKTNLNVRKKGIYFLIDNDEIVYVGKSEKSIFERIRSHKKDDNKEFDSFFYKEINENVDLNRIETMYIAKFTPKYNKSISDYFHYKQVLNFGHEELKVKNGKTEIEVFVVNNKL